MTGWLLAAFNFEPNTVQSPETLMGIKLMMSYIPAGATVIAVIAALFYPLSDKKMAEIEKDLQDLLYIFISSVANIGLMKLKDLIWKALN